MPENDNERKVPLPSVKRLPHYLRLLRSLQNRGRDVVSCTRIADELRLDPTQVRKDLAITGIVGKPRVGYEMPELIRAIEDFLGWNNVTDAVLVGAGHLGTALLGYRGYNDLGIQTVAAFDIDPDKIGKTVYDREIFHIDRMPDLVERLHIQLGILTVPASAAESAVDLMVASGIRGIWNFTPAQLAVPDTVIVENVNLLASLAVLSSRLRTRLTD